MDFFTADEHIDHQRVLEHMPRRGELWTNLGAMTDELIYRHNHAVRNVDRV